MELKSFIEPGKDALYGLVGEVIVSYLGQAVKIDKKILRLIAFLGGAFASDRFTGETRRFLYDLSVVQLFLLVKEFLEERKILSLAPAQFIEPEVIKITVSPEEEKRAVVLKEALTY